MHDLIIRGGVVVDGLGGDPQVADIAVDGDTLTALGLINATGRTEIDATGLIVTPGFVDLHTHLDAQIGWDPDLTPLSWHGVTTAVLGNCGVTFAPCRPGDPEFLAGMMETVEDIPQAAILKGLPWTWEHYGEYLDALDGLDPVINVAGMVGHCAVRYYVMGPRSIDEQPTAAERVEIVETVRAALRAGAVGFSTSRNPGHVIPDGRSVPGTYADSDELIAIAQAVGAEDGLMQTVMNMSQVDEEMDLLGKEGRYARVLFSHYTGRTTSFGDKIEYRVMAMRGEGLDVTAMVIPRSSGYLTGLQGQLPFQGGTWTELAALSFSARLAALRDKAWHRQLIEDAVSVPTMRPDRLYYLGAGDRPNYVSGPDQCLQVMAEVEGSTPAATFLRVMAETDGRALFAARSLNQSLSALASAIDSEFCLPGLGDSGAHVSQIMDSGWATFVLTHWHRDTGLLSLEDTVRRLTSAPARIIGLKDRGSLEVGNKADLNVIQLAQLSERMPEIVYDLPGQAPRFIQKARGYRATICNGKVVLENDRLTGVKAGGVLRASRA